MSADCVHTISYAVQSRLGPSADDVTQSWALHQVRVSGAARVLLNVCSLLGCCRRHRRSQRQHKQLWGADRWLRLYSDPGVQQFSPQVSITSLSSLSSSIEPGKRSSAVLTPYSDWGKELNPTELTQLPVQSCGADNTTLCPAASYVPAGGGGGFCPWHHFLSASSLKHSISSAPAISVLLCPLKSVPAVFVWLLLLHNSSRMSSFPVQDGGTCFRANSGSQCKL